MQTVVQIMSVRPKLDSYVNASVYVSFLVHFIVKNVSWAYKENELSPFRFKNLIFFLTCRLLDLENPRKSTHEMFTMLQTF